MQLTDIFDLSLVGRSSADALKFELPDGTVSTLTFGELDSRSSRIARLFASRGIARGDRLGIFLPNCVEFIDIFLACVRTGIIIVPINVLYREREISHIITDAEPKVVVTTPELEPFVPRAERATASVWLADDLWQAARELDEARVRCVIDGEDAAAIVYTSGTTGRSKGAILSHNNFAANTVNLITCRRITSEDRYLAVLPLFHVHGLGNGIHTWLASGCLMHLAERFSIRSSR